MNPCCLCSLLPVCQRLALNEPSVQMDLLYLTCLSFPFWWNVPFVALNSQEQISDLSISCYLSVLQSEPPFAPGCWTVANNRRPFLFSVFFLFRFHRSSPVQTMRRGWKRSKLYSEGREQEDSVYLIFSSLSQIRKQILLPLFPEVDSVKSLLCLLNL